MKERLRVFGMSVGGLILVLALIVSLSFFGLWYYKFFGPKKENIRREIFENTQSYVQGKAQDLAKYYEEYSKADSNGKESIRQLVILRFAELDETKLQSPRLRSFLVTMRGF